MDHGLYRYSKLPSRPSLRWPGGARLALTIYLYLEYWELDPPAGTVRDPRFKDINGYFFPDYYTYTLREYGNRVGIFRILDMLDRHNLAVTVAANAEACARYPFLVAQCRARGYEFAAHGTHATRMITSRMTEREERDHIAASIAAIAGATGTAPTGWIGQDYGESTRTPALLAEAGLAYAVDWANDDQPYVFTVDPPLISIPNQAEWDDVQLLWHRRVPVTRYPALVAAAAERLHDEGAASGRCFGLHIHPWVLGAPHRLRYLDQTIQALAAMPELWHARAGQVAAHLRQPL